MYKIKIYGAGSIGNHIAHACRGMGWGVSICDTDPDALIRTKENIYPSRYGSWDSEIVLAPADGLDHSIFDAVVIGTPPDTHIDILLRELERGTSKLILVEKPLCGPMLEGCAGLMELAGKKGVTVCVGYNHVLTRNSLKAIELIRSGRLGDIQTMTVNWVEHWGGIFAAHPWLSGPEDSYLGHSSRGGGACGEHSHGINIWQHFAHELGVGRIAQVSAVMERVRTSNVDYDRIAQLSVVSESGLTGYVIQDVITTPPRKQLRIQGDKGVLEWTVNVDPGHDSVRVWDESGWHNEMIPKKRTDDFEGEVHHLKEILDGKVQDSPIDLERGLDTMLVIAAAHRSASEGRTVKITYDAGYALEALG